MNPRRGAILLLLFLASIASAEFPISGTHLGPATIPYSNHTGINVTFAADAERVYLFSHHGCTRLTPDGTILDAEPIAIRGVAHPTSAAAGLGVAVVTHLISQDPERYDGLSAVSADGRLLWHRTDLLARHVVFDGERFVVLGLDVKRAVVVATTIDAAGKVLRTADLGAATPTAWVTGIATDRGVVAVWQTDTEIAMVSVLLGRDGSVGQARSIGASSGLRRDIYSRRAPMAIASNGSEVVVLTTNEVSINGSILPRVRRLSADGTLLAAPIVIAPPSQSPHHVAMAWDGARYRVMWEAPTIETLILDPVGGVIRDASTLPVERGQRPALVVAGGRAIMAWIDSGQGGIRGIVTSASSDLAHLGHDAVTTLQPVRYNTTSPAATWARDHYAVVWATFSTGLTSTLWLRRFDGNGVTLDAEAIRIAVVDDMNWVPLVEVASTGDIDAVAWNDGLPKVVRVRRDGSLVDPQPLRLSTVQSPAVDRAIDIGSNGFEFFVAWGDRGILQGQMLPADRAADRDPFVIAGLPFRYASLPRIAFDGSGYVVGFAYLQFDHFGTASDVHALRVLAGGEVLGPPVSLGIRSGLLEYDLATNGREVAVAWAGGYKLFDPVRLQVVRTERAPASTNYLRYPSIVWTGAEFALAATSEYWRITAHGSSRSALSFPSGFSYAVASRGDGTALFVYTVQMQSGARALFGDILRPRQRATR